MIIFFTFQIWFPVLRYCNYNLFLSTLQAEQKNHQQPRSFSIFRNFAKTSNRFYFTVKLFLSYISVLKLLKMAKGIRALLDTVMQALPQVGNLGLLFFLLFFIFAALGVEMFGRLGNVFQIYFIYFFIEKNWDVRSSFSFKCLKHSLNVLWFV